VRYGTDVVDIDVVDDGRGTASTSGDGPGRGLVGMHERASVLGGSVETGPDDRGGYRVHARLPLNGADRRVADPSR
jgi:signal transduction histidine kinase